MVYKKMVSICMAVSIVLFMISNVVFAADITTNDEIADSMLNILVMIQRYSWPVIAIIFIYALYQYYIAGSELLEQKISGQRLIVGIAVFTVIVQCLPLLYAFAITAV